MPGRYQKPSSILLCAAVVAACTQTAHAAGMPVGFEHKPLPAYPGDSKACYVLLKPREPSIFSSNQAVCRAVLANFNKFCGEPPQYDFRKLHASTTALRAPAWQPLDANQNIELLKNAYLAYSLPRFRQERSANHDVEIRQWASAGLLKLSNAEIDMGSLAGPITAFKVETLQPKEYPGYAQPHLMFAWPGESAPNERFDTLNDSMVADLWSFENRWYLVRFADNFTPFYRYFLVLEVNHPFQDGPVVATERCTIQHVSDRVQGK